MTDIVAQMVQWDEEAEPCTYQSEPRLTILYLFAPELNKVFHANTGTTAPTRKTQSRYAA